MVLRVCRRVLVDAERAPTALRAIASVNSTATASKLLCLRVTGEDFGEKRGILGGQLAFGADALFGGISLQNAKGQAAHSGEIARSIALLDFAGVLSETNIQLPVFVVFNRVQLALTQAFSCFFERKRGFFGH